MWELDVGNSENQTPVSKWDIATETNALIAENHTVFCQVPFIL